VPRGLESCVRILDAIHSEEMNRDLDWSDIRDDVASFGLINGVEASMSRYDEPGVRGHFVPERIREHTLQVLEAVISSSLPPRTRCWYALWAQDTFFGSFDESLAYKVSPIRHCYLYEGSLDSWRSLWPAILPSLWWPDDRSWCVARDVDIRWTYVAGSAKLMERLMASGLSCDQAAWDDEVT
jgi:hypothetical protein